MLTAIALILIGAYVVMPAAIATTLYVFGGIGIFAALCNFMSSIFKNQK